MPPSRFGEQLRTPQAIAAGLLLALSIAYGVLTANILLFSIGPIVVVANLWLLSLFYRLVVAIEHIAYES